MKLVTGPALMALTATLVLLALMATREAGLPLLQRIDAAAWFLVVPAYVTAMTIAAYWAEATYDRDQQVKKLEAQHPGEEPQERGDS